VIYLSGVLRPTAKTHPELGVIITPAHGNSPAVCLPGRIWAADNGCFAQGEQFKMGRYITWLEERVYPYRATCLFATAPDVVGNAEATWMRSSPVLPLIRSLGYKAALVAQNGIDAHMLDWDAFDVLFLGGDTQWKLSQATRHLVKMAKSHGKWVHMGRVNSYKRLERAALWGCDSADGTYVRFRPDAYVGRVCQWLDRVNKQPELLTA